MRDKPIIAITMGDPAGIGPEIIVKALIRNDLYQICSPIVIGDKRVMEGAGRLFSPGLKIKVIERPEEAMPVPGRIELLDQGNVDISRLKHGVPGEMSGRAMIDYIRVAARLAVAGRIDAITTAPINKEATTAAGLKYPGHTEFLADLSGAKDFGMMLVGGNLKVILVTIHVAIKDVPLLITKEKVLNAIRLSHQTLINYFGIDMPKIGVAALNPHAGEGRLFGEEEEREILPAIIQARKEGLGVSEPLPPDTIFHKAYLGDYDIIIAMYHDQGLIPLKMLAFGKAVNVTVGLPFIRTSVDHGTAYDIAGRGLADPGSLIEAIRLAAKMARRRSIKREGVFKQTF